MKTRTITLTGIVLALGVLAFVFRGPLLRWFTLAEAPEAEPAAADSTGDQLAAPQLPEPEGPLSPQAVTAIEPAFAALEPLRLALLQDDLAAAATAAGTVAQHLRSARDALADEAVTAHLAHALAAAQRLAGAEALGPARVHLGEINRALVHLAVHAEGLREGRHLFECPMAEGYQRWFQDPETIANPYMGTAMPMCGVSLDWPAHGAPPADGAPTGRALPDATVETLHAVLAGHERIRDLLANDRTAGITALAREQAQQLRSAAAAAQQAVLADALAAAAAAAEALATIDGDIEAVRQAYGDLTRTLTPLIAVDARLQRELQLFTCPMAQDYGHWFQTGSEMANPYMGQRMLQCGSTAAWSELPLGELAELPRAAVEPVDPDAAVTGDPADIAYWTCSMHPSVEQSQQGTCPICAMDLTPVTLEEQQLGLLLVDEHRRQLIELGTTVVRRAPLVVPLRGDATVTVAEPLRHAVNLRAGGWIEELHADEPGQRIARGEPLFTLYSPELYQAQEEFLVARGSTRFAAARERLRLVGLSEAQIDALAARGSARASIDILAPRDGHLLRSTVIAGEHVDAGKTVMEIVDLATVWLDLEVFAGDLPLVRAGMPVAVELANIPGDAFEATVAFVHPTLNQERRSARLRLAVPNPDLALRPGMHATGRALVDLGERLLVPREAVVYTGPRRLVFLDIGRGRLRPQEIAVGHGTATHLEVRSGLEPGDEVVSSGTFLIASESRVRSAETIWAGDAAAEEADDGDD